MQTYVTNFFKQKYFLEHVKKNSQLVHLGNSQKLEFELLFIPNCIITAKTQFLHLNGHLEYIKQIASRLSG